MTVSVDKIKQLREITGAGVMECRNILERAGGDIDKAVEILKEMGKAKAEKKVTRAARQGIVETYIHTGGRIGAMVELNCESDFVARTDQFKSLAHDIAMQICAQEPRYISREQIPDGSDSEPAVVCLLLQPFIKDPQQTVQDLITAAIARIGENIRVSRFVRFELGQPETLLSALSYADTE